MSQRAGLLVRHGERLAFLPASVARGLLPLPHLTRIPWDSVEMALVAGEVVPVLSLGDPSPELLLCELDGQSLALSGLTAVRVGFWPASGSGVSVDGVNVPALDLNAALSQFRSAHRASQELHHE